MNITDSSNAKAVSVFEASLARISKLFFNFNINCSEFVLYHQPIRVPVLPKPSKKSKLTLIVFKYSLGK